MEETTDTRTHAYNIINMMMNRRRVRHVDGGPEREADRK